MYVRSKVEPWRSGVEGQLTKTPLLWNFFFLRFSVSFSSQNILGLRLVMGLGWLVYLAGWLGSVWLGFEVVIGGTDSNRDPCNFGIAIGMRLYRQTQDVVEGQLSLLMMRKGAERIMPTRAAKAYKHCIVILVYYPCIGPELQCSNKVPISCHYLLPPIIHILLDTTNALPIPSSTPSAKTQNAGLGTRTSDHQLNPTTVLLIPNSRSPTIKLSTASLLIRPPLCSLQKHALPPPREHVISHKSVELGIKFQVPSSWLKTGGELKM